MTGKERSTVNADLFTAAAALRVAAACCLLESGKEKERERVRAREGGGGDGERLCCCYWYGLFLPRSTLTRILYFLIE